MFNGFNFSDLDYTPFEYEDIQVIYNPLLCLLRFRELVCPRGYVGKEDIKKLVCDYIDDLAITNFSDKK